MACSWRVYSTLATQGGVARAAKLDTIACNRLVARDGEPPGVLARGARHDDHLNARVFDIATEPRFETLWDGQRISSTCSAFQSTPRKRRALDFIRFATGPSPGEEARLRLWTGAAVRDRLVGRNPSL
jgi:hypothetical protein